MKFTETQVEDYRQNGFLLIENLFSKTEIDLIKQEMYKVIGEDCSRRILEKSGAVRSFFAPDLSSDLFSRIVRIRKLVEPSSQLIGDEVYAHQTKINSKFAMIGDWWDWHQDYTYWKLDDGMPAPEVLTAMIFLTDVTDFNGPMLLIPGSHKAGTVNEGENIPVRVDNESKWFREYQASATYMSALTADLKYTLKRHTIADWVEKNGIRSAKGAAGTVLFFHGNIFHASSNNLSPWDRHTFLVTYNSIRNCLPEMENPRPGFIANRVFVPILPLEDTALLEPDWQNEKIK
jgi:ectoine hydroxylase